MLEVSSLEYIDPQEYKQILFHTFHNEVHIPALCLITKTIPRPHILHTATTPTLYAVAQHSFIIEVYCEYLLCVELN